MSDEGASRKAQGDEGASRKAQGDEGASRKAQGDEGANQREHADPWTGPWADDARRIFQLIQDATSGDSRAHGEAGSGPAGAHPPECRYCPVCQGIALVRRSGPEVLDRVSELAAGLAATLRAMEPDPDAAQWDGPEPETARGTPRPAPTSTVRIDVTD